LRERGRGRGQIAVNIENIIAKLRSAIKPIIIESLARIF
jgi:hypothetical protein